MKPNFLIAGVLLLAACGSSGVTGGSDDDVAGLVDLGGGRKVYLECRGQGSPTVVLISGGFEAGWIWSYALHPTDPVHEEPIDGFSAGRGDPRKLASAVLSAVGELTRVCTYDRPNTTLGEDIELERQGHISSPVEQPHPVEHDVEDLHAVLNAAGEPGPYVLVAHSYGGLIAELYARTHPEEVAGRVNVDVTSAFLRDTLPPAEYQALVDSTKTPPSPGGEGLEIGAAIDAIDAAEPAPRMPVIVLAADKPPDSAPSTAEGFSRLGEAQRLLAQALCARLITRTNSGHHIHVEQPQLVGDATRAVLEAARNGEAFPCEPVPPPQGDFARRVAIDGGRELYIECRGTGSPTVVLEAGTGDLAEIWSLPPSGPGEAVLPAVARFTRVCAYDRPGTYLLPDRLSRSDPVAMPRSARDIVLDLRALLQAAGVEGPYVLAGHSFGGMIARLYATIDPQRIAGLVMIDAQNEDFIAAYREFLTPEQYRAAVLDPAPPPGFEHDATVERLALEVSGAQMRQAQADTPLRDMPVVVVSHSRDLPNPFGFPPDWPIEELERAFQDSQDRLAALVPDSRHVAATHSGHYIQLEQPALVTEEIRQMICAARGGDGAGDCSAVQLR